jgi:glycosyltransferase involved in cell wall biosynthesis
LNVPTVLTYHTHFEEYLFHYIPFVPRFLLRWLVRYQTRKQCSQVDSVVVPTAAFSRVLREYGVRSELYVNPTGIDPERFTSGDGQRFRRQHNISRHRPVMLFVGRMVHEKNIEFLLQVVSHLREQRSDILLLLVGEGPAQEHFQKQAVQRGLEENIQFIGNLENIQTLCDCYAAGDVFVFASRTETQGLVLLEAMAQGVPVVSTAKLGTVDILRPEKGALVVEENVEAFAGAVYQLLNDRELAQRLGDEGRLYAATWSAQAMAMRLEDIYMETVESAFLFGREISSSRGV